MKTIIIAVILAATVGVASARVPGRPGGHGYYHGGGRTIIVSGGYYPYYGYGAFSPYWGYPYYGYRLATPPSKLDIQVAGIKNDYADKIESVRLDNSLTGKERRAKIKEFRRERNQAVLEARQNYYKQ